MEINKFYVFDFMNGNADAELEASMEEYQKNHEACVKRLHEVQEEAAKLHTSEESDNTAKFNELKDLIDNLEC